MVLIFIILINILVACTSSSPKSTIKKLEKAFNKGDVNGVLDCFDPIMTKGIRAAFNISESFLKINPSDVLDLIPIFYTDFDGKPQVSITVLKNEISGDQARVLSSLELMVEGNKEIGQVYFYMERYEGKWYVMDLDEL